ncbi:MAG: hypothetical protein HY369_02490 [Candidatus Aenigmarchaeota archaeon]|nr:hypothetical protein [Candidatus Aenigmarchaeota archaeon]
MKKRSVLLAAVVLAALVAGYVLAATIQQIQAASYLAGAEAGYRQAVLQLLTEAADCEPFDVFSGNTSATLVNVACLGT